jgi:hypothetical protein
MDQTSPKSKIISINYRRKKKIYLATSEEISLKQYNKI